MSKSVHRVMPTSPFQVASFGEHGCVSFLLPMQRQRVVGKVAGPGLAGGLEGGQVATLPLHAA